jgi:hypothetical protein
MTNRYLVEVLEDPPRWVSEDFFCGCGLEETLKNRVLVLALFG